MILKSWSSKVLKPSLDLYGNSHLGGQLYAQQPIVPHSSMEIFKSSSAKTPQLLIPWSFSELHESRFKSIVLA